MQRAEEMDGSAAAGAEHIDGHLRAPAAARAHPSGRAGGSADSSAGSMQREQLWAGSGAGLFLHTLQPMSLEHAFFCTDARRSWCIVQAEVEP